MVLNLELLRRSSTPGTASPNIGSHAGSHVGSRERIYTELAENTDVEDPWRARGKVLGT
jgi:hypothetical protein